MEDLLHQLALPELELLPEVAALLLLPGCPPSPSPGPQAGQLEGRHRGDRFYISTYLPAI